MNLSAMIYWVSTSLVVFLTTWSAYGYLFQKAAIEGMKELGFPDFFRIQLAVFCVAASVVLIVPQVPSVIKEWAYAGVFFFILTAIIAHWAHKDPLYTAFINLFFLVMLFVSRSYLTEILKR